MRPLLASVSAVLISFLMLSSVFVLEQSSESDEVLGDASELIEFTSARGSSKSFIASGGSPTQSIDPSHIEPDPNGGWVLGSEYNTTLTLVHKLSNELPRTMLENSS
jgi:hypothetical protein